MTAEETEPDTFPKLLLRNSARYGEQPAFREKNRGIWRTMTWREFADEAESIAAALSARDVQRGTHVAFLGENRPRLYAGMAAAHWLGAVAVPLYQDATAEELLAPIQGAEVTHIFAENQEQVDKVLAIMPRCPSILCIVHDKDRGMRHYKQPQLVTYAELLRQGRELADSTRNSLQAEAARGKGDDAAFLFFTSGTTGPAKGVVFAHAPLIGRARVVAAMEGLKDSDIAMAYLPPGWIGQNFFSYIQPMVVGYCVCCPESSDTMLADMREMGPTYFLATPRVLETLLAQISLRADETGGFNQRLYRRCMAFAYRIAAREIEGKPLSILDRWGQWACDLFMYGPLRDVIGLSKIRVAYSAGDAIAPDLLMFFRALGINLKQVYGSTETGFFVAMQREGEIKPDTVGRTLEGVELKFTPQREILVRSPGLFKEYHRDSKTTSQARNAEGWFNTNDIGYLGDDGHLRIVDRKSYVGTLKDGTPFMPKPLENKAKFLPFIKEAVALGESREKVCMLIDIDPGAVGHWADKQAISYTGHSDLASLDAVYELIGDALAKINAELAQDPALAKCQMHRFVILQKELSADEGALTRTGKLRRAAIAERFRSVIDAMYGGRSEARFASVTGEVPADLKIRDVKVAAPARRAA
jgi:long-chain acyl-CoA synthetase